MMTSKEHLATSHLIKVAQETSAHNKWEQTLRASYASHQYASDRLRADSDMYTYVDNGVIYTGPLDNDARWRVRLVDPRHIEVPVR